MTRAHPKRIAATALLAFAALLAGCGSNESDTAGKTAATPVSSPPAAHPTPSQARVVAHKASPRPRRAAVCPPSDRALKGVYHPSRLRVLDPCRHATGTVALVRHEPDGDLHIGVSLDARYRRLLAPANYARERGELVVEFMARDGGHLPEPHPGQSVSLIGAWVDDTQHSWNELHPVWAVSLDGGPTHASGPRFGGSAVGDRSYNAASDCRTASGTTCVGYTGASSESEQRAPSRHTAPSGGSSTGSGCEPGYTPCLPRVGDLNCSDIPADKKPVRVTGSDPYRLDADHNGIGCQSG